MKEIFIKEGYVATIDDKDFELVSRYKWSLYQRKNRKVVYAITHIYKDNGVRTTVKMHNLIYPEYKLIDHKDLNGLNNCRNNLRNASNGQNQRNRGKYKGRSKFKGVTFNRGKWQARIGSGACHYLGRFDTEIAAAKAYDTAALEHYGEFARTNFEKPYSNSA